MRLTVDDVEAGRVRISVSGELDLAAAAELSAVADQAMNDHACDILVLDLAEVTFIDSSGLSAILTVRNSTLDRHVNLRLRGIPPPVQRIFQLTSLDQVFESEPT